MGLVVLVGDRDADPLVRPLETELYLRGLSRVTVAPAALSSVRIAVTADTCTFEGAHLDAVIFRAAPTLLVAPDFTADDAGFASSEFRAAWAHVLALPGTVAVNRAHADAWFSSSERMAWLRRLEARGIATAPRRIGRPWAGGQWTFWTGGIRSLPDDAVCERLGIASIPPGTLRHALVCAGAVLDGDGTDATLDAIAAACTDEGLILGAITMDTAGRLVDVDPVPPIPPALTAAIAQHLGRWIDAALRRRS